MLDYPNTWNSERKGLNKVQFTPWRWFRMWNIKRLLYCICQNHYLFKVGHSFGRLLAFQQLDFNYAKTKLLSTMQVVDWEDPIMHPYCGPNNLKRVLAYTPFKDLNNGFFFLWSRMILSLSLCWWEEHKVMLLRMIKIYISKWWSFNGGFQWKKGQIWFAWRLLKWQVEL